MVAGRGDPGGIYNDPKVSSGPIKKHKTNDRHRKPPRIFLEFIFYRCQCDIGSSWANPENRPFKLILAKIRCEFELLPSNNLLDSKKSKNLLLFMLLGQKMPYLNTVQIWIFLNSFNNHDHCALHTVVKKLREGHKSLWWSLKK